MTKIDKLLIALCLIFPFGGFVYAQTPVPAIMSSNQVWTPANSPYVLSSNAILNQGYTLTIMPGTTVEATGDFRIIVDGEFIAEGTVDSIITFDKVRFEFTDKCVDYDFTNNTGSHFSYCYLIGRPNGGIQTISLKNSNMLIDNCRFLNHYYTIYSTTSGQDSVKVQVFKTIFETEATSSAYGYAFNSSGSNTSLIMDECIILNQYGMFLPNYTKVTRSLFYNCGSWSGIRLSNSANASAIFRCNTFRKFRSSVFEILSTQKSIVIDISNNTFDSADNFIAYSAYSKPDVMPKFEKNNFLTVKNYAFKFSGSFQPGVSDSFDISNNYWGTTDSNVIKSMIYDFTDDITVSAYGYYSPFLTAPIYTCSEQISGIKEMQTSSFKLYPNPTSSISTLSFKETGNKTVRVYDSKGSVLFEMKSDAMEMHVDLSGYTSGMYVIELQEEGKHAAYQKLFLQN